MNKRDRGDVPVAIEQVGRGVWKAPGARIIDRSGRKRLPIGRDGFVPAMRLGTLVDKTLLIADVLDSGYAATLFCRPRRFGKTLNMTMLKAFLEAPEAGGLPTDETKALFADTDIWEADGGAYREYLGAYPVVHFSFNSVKKLTWTDSLAEIRGLVASEYLRHRYLREGDTPLPPEDIAYFDAIAGNKAADADFARSLAVLCRMLRAYHGKDVVVLIDEYDAPVMTGHTYGYYDEVVSFLKGWLTGALKDGGAALAFSCLTGVQRISKESIFSDLNNLRVLTPLDVRSDERYGFTDAEVEALAAYLDHPDCMPEARAWYDGYRFGNVAVYNPWSVINYLDSGCVPGAYWGNTSGNSVIGELVAHADTETLEQVYALLEPGGTVLARLDLGVVFPELGMRGPALWSMLYLAGYLTTEDVEDPSDDMLPRRLRIPNYEVRRLFRNEVLRRFLGVAGGDRRLAGLHRALVAGDTAGFQAELGQMVERTSYLDLTSELPCHMLLMGLLFGVPGYDDPRSNREEGYGRYDIQLQPSTTPQRNAVTARLTTGPRPLITIEVKYLKDEGTQTNAKGPENNGAHREERSLGERLHELAEQALRQIASQKYDVELPANADGRLRWGVAFGGKLVAASCERTV